MARVTVMNNSEFSTGTLLRVYDGIARLDGDEYIELMSVQSAVSDTLEDRGWIFDEEDNEWVCPVNEVAGVRR